MFLFVAVVSRIEAHQPCTHGLGLVDPGLTTIIMVVKLPWLSHCVLDLEGSTVELSSILFGDHVRSDET